jgi:hypothetical protein
MTAGGRGFHADRLQNGRTGLASPPAIPELPVGNYACGSQLDTLY